MPLHPSQKSNYIGFGKMVREEGADYEVNRLLRSVRKYIRGNPLDLAPRRTGLRCDCGSIRIVVEASQLHGNSACLCPLLNPPQSVSIATAHIEDTKRTSERL